MKAMYILLDFKDKIRVKNISYAKDVRGENIMEDEVFIVNILVRILSVQETNGETQKEAFLKISRLYRVFFFVLKIKAYLEIKSI